MSACFRKIASASSPDPASNTVWPRSRRRAGRRHVVLRLGDGSDNREPRPDHRAEHGRCRDRHGHGLRKPDGSSFNDILTGDSYDNVILGGAGNDTIEGGAGNDTLDGGAGTGDVVSYLNALSGVTVNLNLAGPQDTVSAGIDTLAGFESITGSGFNDVLAGDAGANVLLGGNGGDILDGGAGNDTLNGGAGIDTATYASATASATAAVTASLAVTAAQNTGGAGSDTLTGMENLVGSGFNDTLAGSATANSINGGAGNDTITGGGGADVLTGGGGADVFKFTAPSDSTSAARDVVTDFSQGEGDKIDLSLIDAVPGGKDNVFVWGGQVTTAHGVWFATDGTNTTVFADTDGNAGTAEFSLYLTNVSAVTAAGFVL